jgi:hypothetical protein
MITDALDLEEQEPTLSEYGIVCEYIKLLIKYTDRKLHRTAVA